MKSPFSPRSERGSLLIVAMLLCAVIGVSLVSYINVGRQSLTTSNRALYNNAAMNLAENGLEEAMYSINKLVADSTYSFTGNGWTAVGASDMRRKWTGTTFDQNATGEVRVYIYNYNGTAAPKIVARSIITLGGAASATIEKWIEVQLRKSSKFANGLVAKDSITFNGNGAAVDSWNSEYNNDGTPRASPVGYADAYKKDNGSVGSISVSTDAILVQNADIWGYASTGGALPTIGPNGTVGPFGTTVGTMDMARVSTDFTANFDAVTAPTTYSYYNAGNLSSSATLPDDFPGATLQADGKYYIECSAIGGSNNVFNISTGKTVVLKVTNTTGNCIDIKGGSGALNIASGASLEIYAAGDINIGGKGVMNGGTTAATANQAKNLQIWGTKTTGTQAIGIAGNGVLSAVVYAPQGNVTINGNGDVCGSVVANEITLNGSNAKFHYDESLSNFGGNNPYRVTSWNELSSLANRTTYSTVTSF
jgi:Tfp pilus assembly protein PilX